MLPLAVARALRRLRILFGRRRFERDLDDELRFHMEMMAGTHSGCGHSASAVRSLTHKGFGSMAQYREEVRDAHGLTTLDDFWRDVRFAVRTLLRTPGFTIIALIAFALGIGANTTIFSVVNAVLLRPLPYPNADRLVVLNEIVRGQPEVGAVSVLNFQDWRKQSKSFEGVGGYFSSFAMLDGESEPQRVRESLVSANIFPMLGVKPLAGRLFTPEEDAVGKQHVTILSERLWRNRFGAQPDVVGRKITLEGVPYTVVGIMPAGFNFPAGSVPMDLWMPFMPPEEALDPSARGWHWMNVIALRKPEVSVPEADREMKQIARRIEADNPVPQRNRSAIVRTLQESLVGDIRPLLLVLLGAVSLVLLIACANVANLLLARNATRRKDVAVRVALGASRARLARQFLTESIVLAIGGAILGLGVAIAGLQLLGAMGTGALPIIGPVTIDVRVLIVTFTAALTCGIAFGIAPALQLSSNLRHGLGDLTVKTTSGSEMKRFRSGLVAAQLALSLMLLVGAGLLMRGFVALHNTDPGLDPDHVLTARIAVPRRLVTHEGRERNDLLRPLLEQVRTIPGVKAAGLTMMLPIEGTGAEASFWVDRKPWPGDGNVPFLEVRSVSPGFTDALGIRLKMGRNFSELDDTTGTRKAIINEAAVERLLSGENPIGRAVLQGVEAQHTPYEVIGVVSNVKQAGLDVAARPEMYTSYADSRVEWTGGDMSLVMKTTVPELSVVPQVRAAMRNVAKDAAVLNFRPMTEVISGSLSSRKLTLVLFAAFAGVALVLAASGLYGVIYYLVTQRTREFGIRVALGAEASRVMGMVMSQGARLAMVGISVGLLGALLLSRFLGSMLYGVGARDPVTFVVVSVMLGAIATLATLVPAWRATRVDPVIALREE